MKTLGLRRTFEFVVSDGVALGLVCGSGKKGEEEAPTLVPGAATTADTPSQDTATPPPLPSVTSDELKYAKDDAYHELERVLLDWLSQAPDEAPTQPALDPAQEDAVFRSSYIPRNLNEVVDPERDVAVLTRGEGKTLIYGDLTGVVQKFEDEKKAVHFPESGTESEDSEEDSDEEDDEDGKPKQKKSSRRDENKEAKKVRVFRV